MEIGRRSKRGARTEETKGKKDACGNRSMGGGSMRAIGRVGRRLVASSAANLLNPFNSRAFFFVAAAAAAASSLKGHIVVQPSASSSKHQRRQNSKTSKSTSSSFFFHRLRSPPRSLCHLFRSPSTSTTNSPPTQAGVDTSAKPPPPAQPAPDSNGATKPNPEEEGEESKPTPPLYSPPATLNPEVEVFASLVAATHLLDAGHPREAAPLAAPPRPAPARPTAAPSTRSQPASPPRSRWRTSGRGRSPRRGRRCSSCTARPAPAATSRARRRCSTCCCATTSAAGWWRRRRRCGPPRAARTRRARRSSSRATSLSGPNPRLAARVPGGPRGPAAGLQEGARRARGRQRRSGSRAPSGSRWSGCCSATCRGCRSWPRPARAARRKLDLFPASASASAEKHPDEPFVSPDDGPLGAYVALARAVRAGDLQAFADAAAAGADAFAADETLPLVGRLRHAVIRAGLARASAAYARIPLSLLAHRLGLPSAEDAEAVAAKAISDGSLQATIDHDGGFLEAGSGAGGYEGAGPSDALHARTAFCLEIHNEAVRALRYEPAGAAAAAAAAAETAEQATREGEGRGGDGPRHRRGRGRRRGGLDGRHVFELLLKRERERKGEGLGF